MRNSWKDSIHDIGGKRENAEGVREQELSDGETKGGPEPREGSLSTDIYVL